MKIEGTRTLVTGANRGLGRHLAQQLVERGATVFGGVRNPANDVPAGVRPVLIDITNQATIDAAFDMVGPVGLLINNAGASTGASVISGSLETVRGEFETNVYGPLRMIRAAAPGMATLESSAILNVLSVLSWVSVPMASAYCASKSAAWSMTNAARVELHGQNTHVCALHVGFMDTDMVRHIEAPKSDPAVIAMTALDGIESDAVEVWADPFTQLIAASLSGGVASLYPHLVPNRRVATDPNIGGESS